MPHHLVLQPDGKYAVWSTIVDAFLEFNLDEKGALEWHLINDNRWGTYPGGEEALRADVEESIVNIKKAGTAWEWSMDWNRCVRWLERRKNTDVLDDIDGLGLPRRMKRAISSLKAQKYWTQYWRNQANHYRLELDRLRRELRETSQNKVAQN